MVRKICGRRTLPDVISCGRGNSSSARCRKRLVMAKGFWTNVDGQMVHAQGDPNMSEETLNAIAELVRCAVRAIENGTLRKEDDMEQVIQWFTYDEIQQNPALLERVIRTPGAKVVRDFAVQDYYKRVRYVA